MRIWMPRSLCLLALAACAPLAHAQIYHCIGAHGEPVFSGEPCATPAPSASTMAGHGHGQRFGDPCADSPDALRQALANVFTTHDVNRLAGLILWRDMDQASALTTLRSLSAWLQQPLTGIAIAYPTGPPFAPGPQPAVSAGDPAADSSAASPPPNGFEVSTGGADGGTRDFGVTQSGRCWWLTF
ncbi:MAG: DUF4124 domain-containing protein [Xanthomonadaceae bacterium]|nr:DUF4124 domain-containing protein [Xanthomonadaceae bacterium]